MKNNIFIKKLLKENKINQYLVAEKLNMGETTLCRLLRHEIDKDLENNIIKIIKEMKLIEKK